MRIASTIFTWLGGLATTILAFVSVSNGYQVGKYHQQTPGWLWAVLVGAAIFRFIILMWRQIAIHNGKKIAPGIFTLLFVSVIGGILTLCIPEDDLY